MMGHRCRQVMAELRRFFLQLSASGKRWVIIGCLGHAWALVVVMPAAYQAINKPSAEDQQPYEPPGSLHPGDIGMLASRLRGWPTASGKNDRKSCWSAESLWADERILVRGLGPSNGATVTAWVSETEDNEVFLGRYSYDLHYFAWVGTGPHGWLDVRQGARNTRFIERVPPPAPGPPGWRVIQPGQCVLAREKCGDEDETMGKFLIDLPAKQRIQIRTVTPFGHPEPTIERLSFNGKEAAHEPIPGGEMGGFYYRSDQAGRYTLTIHRPPGLGNEKVECKEGTPFSVDVEWGELMNGSCTHPDEELTCLGDLKND